VTKINICDSSVEISYDRLVVLSASEYEKLLAAKSKQMTSTTPPTSELPIGLCLVENKQK